MNQEGKVAFQGERGANSDLAARVVFPNHETLPCTTFEDAFAAVEDDRAQYALIPIDNVIAGRVADIHALLPRTKTHIIGEHFQPIEHCLLGIPGSSLETITTVRSHVHALAQCRKFLAQHTYTSDVAQDTAGAARELASNPDIHIAAIAPALAAELYGLEVLAQDIADTQGNVTRFIILSREETMPAPTTPCITSLFFKVKDVPASLHKAIAGFAEEGINLLKLESYLRSDFKTSDLYLEIGAHPAEERTRRALAVLAGVCEEVRILGTYPEHPFRSKE